MEELEREALVEALDRHAGRDEAVGRELGLSRATTYRRIRRYRIDVAAAAAARLTRSRHPAAGRHNDAMIFIVVKFTSKPEVRDTFLEQVRPFTEATRGEQGVLWFDWSVSVDDPHQFVLVEAFRDADAGAAHVASEHFQAGIATLSTLAAKTPDIINVEVPGTSWSAMGEVTVE